MRIKSIRVKNFRSILDESIECDGLTVIVGRNGAGKSSFLKAMDLFYDQKSVVSTEDFYDEDTSREIEIAVTFADLSDDERNLFSPYVDGADLIVVRVFAPPGTKSGTYHGMRLQNLDFAPVRQAGGKREVLAAYKGMREQAAYSALPVAGKADDALEAMKQWEAANPGRCTKQRDDGQFFGFTEVANGYLGRHTRFIHIPAVRDASNDATEGRGSCVTEIMDLVVRRALASRTDLATLKTTTQTKYRELMAPANLTELSRLEQQLSETLRYYAPEANITMEWSKLADVDFPLPRAEIKLHEDGYKSSVERTGHGLQRAFVLTMLQHLVAAKSSEAAAGESVPSEAEVLAGPQLPSLVLAIEEPELYQHPSRQRHMAAVLLKLSEGEIPGVAKRTQVLYSTHSPLFVGLDRFDQIRLLRKVDNVPGKPRVTRAVRADLDAVAQEIWVAGGSRGDKHTAQTLRPRLQAVMTPWVNEGFFADIAVLVEGEGDRAAILGVAAQMGYDFDSEGIAIIPCIGKNNLDRPLVIFGRLGVPVYVVWDGDHGRPDAKGDDNRRLLRLVGSVEEDWPCAVEAKYACFKDRLEETLKGEIGAELFARILSETQNALDVRRKTDALKNPIVLQRVIALASAEGKASATLRGIVDRIVALKSQRQVAP